MVDTTQDKRQQFLEQLRRDFPEMKVHCIKKYDNYSWASEKTLKDLSDVEMGEVNLRKSRPNEVIFDVENMEAVQKVREKLEILQWPYEMWWTGSRGAHLSVLFENLGEFDLELRNRIRRYLIKDVGTDEALSRESQWLALEYTPHFKTGKEKYLFDKHAPEITMNKVSDKIIDYCKENIEEKTKSESNITLSDNEFRDFYKNDPYIKYALTNQIISGERNNVLFKNLAIGLVRSGLERNEINKIIEAIVANCPGKNASEFHGWIDKVYTGEIVEFNRAEMIAWAERYKHPQFYSLGIEINKKDFLSIKQIWNIIWNSKIAEQDMWRDLAFYNMLGTVVDERVEDFRVHVIFSSDPGSGKDEGLNIIERVLNDLQIETSRPSSVTDRTLIGAVNQKAVEFNTMYGLSPENPISANGKKEYKEPKEVGLLATKQWMAFGESESVFKPGAHNRLIQSIFRQAMDKSRRVEKGVSGEEIKVSTNISFALVTYAMDDIIYKILNNGLFQRSIYLNKSLTEEEDQKILDHIIRAKFNNEVRREFPEDEYFNLLKERLMKARLWYDENKNDIKYFEMSQAYVTKLWSDYKASYEALPGSDKFILNSIRRRAAINLDKLLFLTAVWKQKTVLQKEDIDECFGLLTKCIDSIKDLVLRFNKESKEIAVLVFLLKDSGKSVSDLDKELEKQLNVKSSRTKVKIRKRLIDLGFASEYPNAGHTYLSLTDKGRSFVE